MNCNPGDSEGVLTVLSPTQERRVNTQIIKRCMMDPNLLIFAIGCLIIVISVFILIKNQQLDYTNEIEESDYLQEQLRRITMTTENDLQNQINEIKEEVHLIREDIQLVYSLTQSVKPTTDRDSEAKDQEESFSQLLNYKIFAEKNGDIINLLKLGEHPQAIAKKQNKSVREVEMIMKLIK
ncbi:hypothetical protein Amet_2691 [Alkaliphilus metalliredigens QYMF]|uniref:Uncharacterized protein n=1 Tax=Alkaliphilus metalliredigens (strain QYMF) TaxID=293826 RepID=A6TRM5_ALKMQ|nr:hypothetical protein [Alkaliphilus metalliredigens]ABR48843.1 hypothetical protein Amet_2691 [Alkaliphilus metalliredigens QYMF]